MRRFKVLPVIALALLTGKPESFAATGPLPPLSPGQALKWEPTTASHTLTNGEAGVRFTFQVTNVSTAEVTITQVKPECGCTAAEMPSHPWVLKPGEGGHFDAVVDMRDTNKLMLSPGVYFKQIAVIGTNFTNMLNLNVAVSPLVSASGTVAELARQYGQQLSSIDRQAPFKNDCVKCHLVPAFGKESENLFHTACGICHEATNRASFVPDLAKLTAPVDTNYWRQMVTYGKTNTLMPGFASTQGGPLTAQQIDSLVGYLSNAFPRPLLKAAPAK